MSETDAMEYVSDSDTLSTGVSDSDWAQVEEDLRRLCALHTEVSQRMEILQRSLAMEETGFLPVIQTCHEASQEELEQTGEVTFGARLLMALQGLSQ